MNSPGVVGASFECFAFFPKTSVVKSADFQIEFRFGLMGFPEQERADQSRNSVSQAS